MDSDEVIFWIIVGAIILFSLYRKRREKIREETANAIRSLLLELNYCRKDMEGQNILAMEFEQKLAKFSDDDLCNMFDFHCTNIDANMVLDGVPLDFIKLMRSRMGDSGILRKANELKDITALLAMIIDIDNTRYTRYTIL